MEFEVLAEQATPKLRKAYIAIRGADGADEATAEAMAWGWENRERLLSMDNPVGYLYRVGVSRTSLRKPLVLPDPVEVNCPEVEPGLIPALISLPEKQRIAVWLIHGCQWSYAEVSEALDVSTSTVGTHITRALESLRRELGVEQR